MSFRSVINRLQFKPDPKDIVIVVMGPTGAGKSNFVNALTGNVEEFRASSLKSHTHDVTAYTVERDGHRFVFVDTPGFGDTNRPDTMILRIIADWLTQKYSNGATLNVAGIVYLHRITDNRMSGSVYKNLQMFGRLCGDLPLRRARLVTTMWDKATNTEVAESRERQLTGDFWRPLLDEGASAERFDNTPGCAWNIVHGLTGLGKDGDELLLQEEIVEQHKRVNETEAAKVLYSRFQVLLAQQKKMLKDLADEAKLANDPALARSLREEYDKVDSQLQQTLDQMNVMKIPLARRIVLWLFTRQSHTRAVRLDDQPVPG